MRHVCRQCPGSHPRRASEMKITFLIESLSANRGGPPRDAASCARWLSWEHHHEVTILTLADDAPRVELSPGIKVEEIEGNAANPLTWMRAARKVGTFLKDSDLLVVHGLWGPIDGLALRWANWGGCPVYIRTLGMLEPFIVKRNGWKKSIARKVYVNSNLRRASALIISTNTEESQVRNLGFKSPLLKIPNGVDLENFIIPERERHRARMGLGEADEVLLYLGRIHPKKGLHLLVEALRILKGKLDNFLLLVAGACDDKPYGDKLAHQIKESGLAGKIRFLGALDDFQKREILAVSDLFVLPSYSEGFSNAVLEAMASRLPVLITEGCNFPDVETFGAGIITRPTADSISHGLERILSDRHASREMGARGRRLIEKQYDWRHLSRAYHELICSEKKPLSGMPVSIV